jgi:hypothetical protein
VPNKTENYVFDLADLLGLPRDFELNISSIEGAIGQNYIFERTNDKSSQECSKFKSKSYTFYQLYRSKGDTVNRSSFFYKVVSDRSGNIVCVDRLNINTDI